ncbi:MAG: hypothetical protein ABJ308_08060 [Halieaceae bacterium]
MKIAHYLLAFASLGLVACEQVQLNGPIGGATITVTELRSDDSIVSGEMTDDPAAIIAGQGQQAYDDLGPVAQLWFLGLHTFTDSSVFVPTTWYLMSVSGGADYDADKNSVIDAQATPVNGVVHAIVTGAQLKASGFSVTPLTEAAYQQVKDYIALLNDSQLQAALDALAPELVGDVDASEVVDYTDVIKWNPILHAPLAVADSADVGALALSVTVGEPDDSVQAKAAALFTDKAPAGVAELIYADSISDIIDAPLGSGGCGVGCHYPGGSGAVASDNDLVPTSTADFVALNTDNFRMLVETKGAALVLNKVAGIAHAGGVRHQPGSDAYEALEDWLNLL